ncbi:Zinc finger protein 385A Hematopoietic zinc finger protein Retinal zinc finger protein [Channa argus]|uniref:Zinc finger protein 385A Hematopoietic zinc finger protein Retinal zinc finger protein n=1 Tax=Channa argus TaxID=215402 RepID=A0A6G1Q2X8_CHAAH|nr:Zinc finger protein 385A Hematopoietic zinc finger protein Retinal zinc finger protein [Channa argus]
MILGGINRAGAAVPTFLRTPTVIQPHLDMKPFLQFPMETPPPPHSMSLFHNFNTMDPVQKAVINHTFGVPLVKTKRPVISCNVCQIRFNSESQAEAHYKGNRHARRVKGIETSKSRPQEGDKPNTVPPTSSPSPPGAPGNAPDSEPSKADETRPLSQLNGPLLTPGSLPALTSSPTPPMDAPLSSICPLLSNTTPSLIPPSSSPGCGSGSGNSEQPGSGLLVSGATGTSASSSPSNPETEEDKAKKLLYCSLCKVAVNSLSQLEAHNKGTKHKTILEARSGLGPIKAYPRLGPKPSGEQGGGPVDPNTQERTFHCEICNVRVNSELQLKQHISSRRHRDGMAGKPNPLLSRHKKHRGADLTSSLTFSKDLTKALGAGLLPNPLAVAAAMAAAASSNPLALRAAAPAHHPHHHLLQGPPLSHAILRPAPGPIRTTHGPILFSPY